MYVDYYSSFLILLSILAVSISASKTAKFHLKYAAVNLSFLLSITMSLPAMFAIGRSPKSGLLPSKLGLLFAKLIGFTVEIRGLNNIKDSEGAVFILNHQNHIDITVISILYLNVRNFSCVAKKELFYMWPVGLGLWFMNFFFVDRKSKENSTKIVSESAKAIRDENFKIAYFVEGTRNNKKELLPFKLGAFHAAIEAGCPIQPVAVSRQYFLNTEKKIFRNGHIIVEVMPTISTEKLTKDNIKEFASTCRSILQNKIDDLTTEVMQKYKID